jgi:acetyl-CoA synthetase
VVFDYRDGEVFWCTADVGWVTGHSYIVYGPLANGAISLMFEGVPNYPDTSRFWQVVDKHQVNIFYTAPTALRALMREAPAAAGHLAQKPAPARQRRRADQPEAWEWYFEAVGQALPDRRYLVADRNRRHHAHPCPAPTDQTRLRHPADVRRATGAAGRKGKLIEGPGAGVLAIKASWPGQIRSVYGDHQRMVDTYFKPCPATTSPATAPAATPMATTGSPGASTM